MPKKSPKSQYEDLKNRLQELEDKHKRALADYQNLERRHELRLQEIIRFSNQDFITSLLPVIDHLYLAQKHLNDSGLDMVVKQLEDILKAEGVTKIKAENEPFNPETMDCVETVDAPENHVAAVVSDGYLYHDRVLRPAKVKVGAQKSTNAGKN